ncbi:type III-B CRISPR module RAMP protein Cmr6 [Arcicella aquatica]|uniref:Type III-B CRISPR module RAMP protein Cmr6 n=1 Tax=Arcicella aquatica TaxID=217141 RepID=A0ABU5QUI2_9BACT|nr:type III-B CRISPR module RAMP protein Cmr6 [Arcicella aquatica]MEA5260329.1 type III-B CRISPR module RAMP protein Cmr6 [Arcicella aquatica]
MTKLNIHKLFYKDYFASPIRTGRKEEKNLSFSFDGLHEINTQIISSKYEMFKQQAEELKIASASTISLTTKYPGLLVGAGYDHETHSDNELKLGFSFDFTTGLPIIPGSSIKGILRSAFRKKINNKPYALAKALLAEINVDLTEEQCEMLEIELFGSSENNEQSILERDIFYDAIIDPLHVGLFLGNDYITPHRNRTHPEMSPYTNPIPLPFLKIKPNVKLIFQFGLKNRTSQLLNNKQRLDFYKKTLKLLGVGAKTRLGYGKFKDE